MDKRVHRLTLCVDTRQAPVTLGKRIAKFDQCGTQIFRCVGPLNAVVQMDLDLAQAFGLHFGHDL